VGLDAAHDEYLVVLACVSQGSNLEPRRRRHISDPLGSLGLGTPYRGWSLSKYLVG